MNRTVALNFEGRGKIPPFVSMFFILLFVFGIVFGELRADAAKAELIVEAEVPVEIKLSRVDEGKALNLFGGTAEYQIEANTLEGVDIKIESRNGGVAKHTKNPDYSIEYVLSVSLGDEEWNQIMEFPSEIEIPQDKFTKGRCSFSLKSEVKDENENPIAGSYSDTLTISVKAHE